ncbi:hypothetical protein GCM10010123_23700 [Pilimelia anulata]|uniref:TerB N-terminal domain-containing protein n=1 Tax=Pilimelia anulata TaxID=53371 RepID=A0A8J3FAN6_9ACTN|nr:TerB N-terminal domain-containing protein [Pilimelia anulata]GGJ93099.1 hypothetical protein GCM10010123_23700 [Pilimelia anulata]
MTTSTARPGTGLPAATRPAVWLSADAPPVTVRGYRIAGGLIHLGGPVPAAYRTGPEPAVVDPELPVRRVRLDQETPAGDAAPAYAALTAGARAAYLEWLADGRTGETPAAHLWLYLAGLERRVLHDLAGDPDGLADYVAIGAEVNRLRREYGHLTAFDAQAAAFETTVDGLAALADPHLHPPTLLGRLSPPLVAGLGRYLAAEQPLPAAWVFAWAVAAGHQAADEASRAEFLDRFAATHPDGLVVPTPPAPFTLSYRPVNTGFADRTVTLRTPVPDIRSLDVDLVALLGPAAPRVRLPRVTGRAAAVHALLRLIVLAGADDELLDLVSRHLYELHQLTAPVRGQLADALSRFVAAAPPVAEVRSRYATLAPAETDAIARLLIATTSVEAVVEPEHAQLLAAAYDVLGPGEADLCRRLRGLEVAAVVTDSDRADATATVLDDAMVAAALRDCAAPLILLDDLLTP